MFESFITLSLSAEEIEIAGSARRMAELGIESRLHDFQVFVFLGLVIKVQVLKLNGL